MVYLGILEYLHIQANSIKGTRIMKFLFRVSLILTLLLYAVSAQSQENTTDQWKSILQKAKGQTIYFNAWGGAEPINDYILWAASETKKRYDVEVKHVKVTDIGEVVSRILAEKSANRTSDGSVDLVWINGENFRAMKEQGLLAKPYTQILPNYALVDTENKPTTLYDFTTPVDNMEAPWGMAQLVFMYDSEKISSPPQDMATLLEVAAKYPGRFTYPAPPNFYGTTFIKQALIELIGDAEILSKPVDEDLFTEYTEPLWSYLDKLHPFMWRNGKTFTANASEMKQLLNDSEIFISLTFNPNDASNAIANDELPESIRSYVHKGGTIGNSHFVALVFNSSAKEGAMVFADFLMSAEAQARKADPAIWGDPTVLATHKLSDTDKTLFSKIPKGVATLSAEDLSKVLPEPHPSWVAALEKEWQARYSK